MASVVPAFNVDSKKLSDGSVIDINTGEVISRPTNPPPESPIKKLSDGAVIDFGSELVLTSAPRGGELIGGVELTLYSPEWESLFNAIAAVEYFDPKTERWTTKNLTGEAIKAYGAILRRYKRQGDEMQTITLKSTEMAMEAGITLSKVSGCISILQSTKLIKFDRRSRGYFIYLYRPATFLEECTPIVQSFDDVNDQYVRSRYGKCTEGKDMRRAV